MLKRSVFLCAMAWGCTLWAKPVCWQLVSSPPTLDLTSHAKMAAARLWRESFLGGRNLRGFNSFLENQGLDVTRMSSAQLNDWMDRMVLHHWQNWSAIRPEQREAALTLELRRLSSAPNQNNVITLSGSEQLRILSAANKARLLAHLNQANPIADNAEIHQIAEAIARNLVFNYIHPSSVTRRTGEAEPLVSGRELARLGLRYSGDWFSDLLNPSASVGFQMIATNAALGPRELSEIQYSNPYRLSDAFARANGFIIPRPVSPVALMQIFARWQPSALEEVLGALRFSLPNGISTVAALADYLTIDRLNSIIPSERQDQLLAPLRTRLNQFIFTTSDGEDFLRKAFVHYLIWRANGNRGEIDKLAAQFSETGGAHRLTVLGFREFLGLGAMQLRIPVAVDATDYQIVSDSPDVGRQQQQMSFHPLNPRGGLDHTTQP